MGPEARRRVGTALAVLLGASPAACGDDLPADHEAGTEGGGDPGGPTTGIDTGAIGDTEGTGDTGADAGSDLPPSTEPFERTVFVTLDGEPVEGAKVLQAGSRDVVYSGPDGRVTVTIDPSIIGDQVVVAGLPNARIRGATVPAEDTEIAIALDTAQWGENLDYVFENPGTPDDNGDTSKCAHCHETLNEDWFGSPHRESASNPVVQDIYAGVASSFEDQGSCEGAGGQWWMGIEPGSGEPGFRCYLGAGVLPDLNEGCGEEQPCDTVATQFGACADCHAPGIDGKLGGRDLLEATGRAYDFGVHCDVCHKVESIDMEAEPGVAGRLVVKRPLEPAMGAGLGEWAPMVFAPYPDVPNPRMGAMERDHFEGAAFCAGCHQQWQEVLLPGESLDAERWPEGRLPVHTTYEEWQAGALADVTPCQGCHMPPMASALNAADLEVLSMAGVASGWVREPGAVHEHSWIGPRTPSSNMLQLAATIFVDSEVQGGTLTIQVTVKNVGPGHALPTGEPLRSMVLAVEARCEDEPLIPTGGDVIPSFAGGKLRKTAPEDWGVWPGAEVGDVIRVTSWDGAWVDYEGFGPFGDGTFTAAQKGLPAEDYVGSATVIAVNGETVTLDAPLPDGDFATLGDAGYFEAPSLAGPPRAVAGAPGFAFARVMAGPDGALMVPHHRAVDVVVDNRLAPQQSHTSTHEFAATCASPVVHAALLYRPYPVDLARERQWAGADETLMVEVFE